MEYIFMFAAVIILVIAFLIASKLKLKFSSDSESEFRTQKGESGKVEFISCPVCNTPLTKKENLHSRIFRPMNTPDQRMMVQGCPHCYPHAKGGIKRMCPVCHKILSEEDELVARLFNRAENKKHVMIMGCSHCMGVGKK